MTAQPPTAQPPDPDPSRTPGLDAGGGVQPGDTPPDSGQTSGVANPHPPARRRISPLMIVSLIGLALFVALFVAVAVGLLAHIP
ncbi:DUF6480 family protein [Mycobacterium kubicae]|uniref:Uncharacterized protein n=1 Tax=Mycobacterium kubicae TaxID=120959 RepID=A0AAX1J4M9_9MYCO|nr:DUF6480 family protein [Mycobacterium kubicae]MCV7093620.1 hypothetical protein [Mycobacterium kubicae]OBK49021.1 hypothetical protein A5657_01810 [Mycobacterium kubicae]ORW02342.1 hypothetical protein AWC13_04300 [Mycobacterium kubicae]QNI07782.1 hypothetical protein GAN17_17015 [Mycobacterium kubicae]QNI12854.1 hypothetical protein GAN18_18200 [Mycobacterium kubicae]